MECHIFVQMERKYLKMQQPTLQLVIIYLCLKKYQLVSQQYESVAGIQFPCSNSSHSNQHLLVTVMPSAHTVICVLRRKAWFSDTESHWAPPSSIHFYPRVLTLSSYAFNSGAYSLEEKTLRYANTCKTKIRYINQYIVYIIFKYTFSFTWILQMQKI